MIIAIILTNVILGICLISIYRSLQALTKGQIKKLEHENKALSDKAVKWMEHRDSVLILLRSLTLFNLSSFAITVYFTLSNQANSQLSLIGFTGLALCSYMIITEILSAWMTNHMWLLLNISMPIMMALRFPFMPIVLPSMFFMKEIKHESESESEKASAVDEIEALLDDEEDNEEIKPGEITDDLNESKMIRGVLDLDETPVKEIMTPRVDLSAISIEDDVDTAMKTIITSGHSRIPVYKGSIDDIVGIIYSRDLLKQEYEEKELDLESLMHRPVYIPESKNVRDLLKEIKQRQIHIAVVIDEWGGTSGVVTLEDILEEIVGEIADEFDVDQEEEILQLAQDGSLTIDARTPIDDVNYALKLSLPEDEDNVTIGGYLTSQIGSIPKTGETHKLNDVQYLILEADERKVSRIKIEKLDVIESTNS